LALIILVLSVATIAACVTTDAEGAKELPVWPGILGVFGCVAVIIIGFVAVLTFCEDGNGKQWLADKFKKTIRGDDDA
jgi:hypothetical protein